MENLRPVEDFPHTPLIPIDDGQMRRYQESVERRKQNPFLFAMRRERVWSAVLFGMAVGVVLFFVQTLLKLEENMLYDYEQLKIRRYGDEPRTIEEARYMSQAQQMRRRSE